MPVPDWVTEPVPLMALGTVSVSVRLNTSAPLSVTGPVPSVPEVLPSPTWTVPPVIAVAV